MSKQPGTMKRWQECLIWLAFGIVAGVSVTAFLLWAAGLMHF